MSIELETIKDKNGRVMGMMVLLSSPDSWKNFQTLVNRATNCWDTAPAEIKEFADMVTEGRVLQDYATQSKMSRTEDSYDQLL